MRRRRTEAASRKLPKFSAREWDIYRRGFESGRVIGREDGLELAAEPPRRARRVLTLREVMKATTLTDNKVVYEREVLAWRDGRPRAR